MHKLVQKYGTPVFVLVGAIVLALLPLTISSYYISLLILLWANVALATAWSIFSGATRYISLATSAFIGVGMYSVAVLHTFIPVWLALIAAALVGLLIALLVGLSTLRLRGVYFVIFTFGLTELIHQMVIWWEVNLNRTLSRFIFVDLSNVAVYELLLLLAAATIIGSWYVSRARLGYGLRAIGEDETVAKHIGINTTRVKVFVFAGSAAIMSLVGAVLSLRYPYVDPNIAFNNLWSFQVLIAALLGGPGVWGPALGAIPLVLLSEVLAGTFPHHFSIALGIFFVLIVYFLPGGVSTKLDGWLRGQTIAQQPKPAAQQLSPIPRASGLAPSTVSGETLLDVQGLYKAFGGLVAVNDLSFSVPRGAIVGLIGPNGSGKTTAINLLTGEVAADHGTALFQGTDILQLDSFEVCRSRVARTFQLVRTLEGMTVRETILVARMFGSHPTTPALAASDVEILLERTGLSEQGDLYGSQLTYIDQKRVELARALATQPQLLLLDEWLAGLNPTELQIGIQLIDKIRREGVTIIMVEHVMEAIRALCDQVYVMNAGELIAQGKPDQVLSEPRVLQVYLGTDDAEA